MPLQPYEAVVNGTRTTLLLTADEAAQAGLAAATVVPAKKRTPANKAVAPGANKGL